MRRKILLGLLILLTMTMQPLLLVQPEGVEVAGEEVYPITPHSMNPNYEEI